MKGQYTDFWYRCRETTQSSRMDVAEYIDKSFETVGAYERGDTLVPPEVCLMLEEFLLKPGAALEYLILTNPVAAKYIPKPSGGILESAVQISLSAKELIDGSNELLRAAMDGTLLNDSPEIVQRSHKIFMNLVSSAMVMIPQMVAAGVAG